MVTIKGTRYVYFDVDNTLVFSHNEWPDYYSKFGGELIGIRDRGFIISKEHSDLLKDFKARGHIVVVWSAGGAEWAETVVKALKIEDKVDLCIGKPDWAFDDNLRIQVAYNEKVRPGGKNDY